MKDFVSCGSIFSPFRVDPFSDEKRLDVQETKQEVTKVVSLVKNCREFITCIQSLSGVGAVTLVKLIFLPSEKGSTLKEKNKCVNNKNKSCRRKVFPLKVNLLFPL